MHLLDDLLSTLQGHIGDDDVLSADTSSRADVVGTILSSVDSDGENTFFILEDCLKHLWKDQDDVNRGDPSSATGSSSAVDGASRPNHAPRLMMPLRPGTQRQTR